MGGNPLEPIGPWRAKKKSGSADSVATSSHGHVKSTLVGNPNHADFVVIETNRNEGSIVAGAELLVVGCVHSS